MINVFKSHKGVRKIITLSIIISTLFLSLYSAFTYAISNPFDDNVPKSCNIKLLWNYTMGDGGRGLDITPDGKFLAVGSWDNNVYLFDTSNPIPLWNKTLPGMIGEVAISDDGNYIAAACEDNKLYFFHKSSSNPLWNFTAGNLVRAVKMTPDGQYIVMGSWNYHVFLFDRASSTPLWNYSLGNRVYHVDITSDGQYLVVGGLNTDLHVFNMSTTPTELWVNNSMSTVYGMEISDNDEYLVVGTSTGGTGTIYLFDLLNPNPLQTYEASHTIGHVSISTDGKYFTGTESLTSNCYLFERGIANPVWNFTANDQIEEIDISSDGNYIGCGSYDYTFYLFNRPNIYANKEKAEMLSTHTLETGGLVYSVELSATGEFISVLSNDDHIYMFYNEIGTSEQDQPSISFGFHFIVFGVASIIVIILVKKEKANSRTQLKK